MELHWRSKCGFNAGKARLVDGICEQVDALDRQVNLRAKSDAAARRLMTVPGVGVIVALAYTAVIDNLNRFKRGTSVGAYLGLTRRRYQFGEVDTAGGISKCGDGLLGSYLFEAANVVLSRHPRLYKLKTSGQALAKRIGMRRAKVAVARKLAVVMHRVWKRRLRLRLGRCPGGSRITISGPHVGRLSSA